jgi:hypothetical protein
MTTSRNTISVTDNSRSQVISQTESSFENSIDRPKKIHLFIQWTSRSSSSFSSCWIYGDPFYCKNEERITVSNVQLNRILQAIYFIRRCRISAWLNWQQQNVASFRQTPRERRSPCSVCVQQAAVHNEWDGRFIQAVVSMCHAHSTVHMQCDRKLNLNTGWVKFEHWLSDGLKQRRKSNLLSL